MVVTPRGGGRTYVVVVAFCVVQIGLVYENFASPPRGENATRDPFLGKNVPD